MEKSDFLKMPGQVLIALNNGKVAPIKKDWACIMVANIRLEMLRDQIHEQIDKAFSRSRAQDLLKMYAETGNIIFAGHPADRFICGVDPYIMDEPGCIQMPMTVYDPAKHKFITLSPQS
jgi:hypothetical protein